jgi:dual specificity tyrosine-phosphorylation-regulated kinase 2/3/4
MSASKSLGTLNFRCDVGKEEASVQLPASQAVVKRKYSSMLTEYEKEEIKDYDEIYYLGKFESKVIWKREAPNFGFDHASGHYRGMPGDHIAYRYEVLDSAGKGEFGEVLKCIDHKTSKVVAIKVLVNTELMNRQGLIEIANMKKLSGSPGRCVIQLIHSFTFRNHLCIVTDLMHESIFGFMRSNDFAPLPMSQVRTITRDMLIGLSYIHSQRIIHCDMKPENVMFTNEEHSSVQIVDFGSSCEFDVHLFNYVQTLYYRAPEVILRSEYGPAIDIWSVGCIVAEMVTGRAIFHGSNDYDQLSQIIEVLGNPPFDMIQKSSIGSKLFATDGTLKHMPGCQVRKPFKVTLSSFLKTSDSGLVNFLSKCLEWGPSKRLTADACLQHRWLVGGH